MHTDVEDYSAARLSGLDHLRLLAMDVLSDYELFWANGKYILTTLAIFFPLARSTTRAATYSALQLQTPAPFVGFYTASLTDDGLIPGYARQLSGTEIRAVSWSAATGAMTFLLPPTVSYSVAEATASPERFVGEVVQAGDDDPSPAIIEGGTYHTLPLPGRFGLATATNGSSVVGYSLQENSPVAIWQDEQFVGLIASLPGTIHTPFEMNSHGRYVGVYADVGIYGGFVGEGLDAHELILPGFPLIRALGINDDNKIVGIFLPDGNARVGYVAHVDGHGNYTATALSPLPGQLESPVWAVNNNGDMVGLSTPSANSFDETATVYFAGSTTPVDMNTLIDPMPGVHLVRGIDINNQGQILVEGTSPQGFRYFVLTPVPEPLDLHASVFLLTLALIQRKRTTTDSISLKAQP